MKAITESLSIVVLVLIMVSSSQAQNRYSKTQVPGYEEATKNIKNQNRYKIRNSQKALRSSTYRAKKRKGVNFSKSNEGRSQKGSMTTMASRKSKNRNPAAGKKLEIASKSVTKVKLGGKLGIGTR